MFNKKMRIFFKQSKELTLVVRSGKIVDIQNGQHCVGQLVLVMDEPNIELRRGRKRGRIFHCDSCISTKGVLFDVNVTAALGGDLVYKQCPGIGEVDGWCDYN